MTREDIVWAAATVELHESAETPSKLLPAAGLALLLLAAQFMTVLMLAASMAPGYDIAGGAISDLGTIPATAGLFNASLVLTGVLNVAAGLLLWRAGWGLAVLVLHVVAGVGAVGAGLVTLATPGVHGLFALLAFLGFNLQAPAHARRLAGPLRWIALGLGLLGLAFTALMALGDAGDPGWFGPIGHGGTERMIVYPPMLWLMALGGALIGLRSRN